MQLTPAEIPTLFQSIIDSELPIDKALHTCDLNPAVSKALCKDHFQSNFVYMDKQLTTPELTPLLDFLWLLFTPDEFVQELLGDAITVHEYANYLFNKLRDAPCSFSEQSLATIETRNPRLMPEVQKARKARLIQKIEANTALSTELRADAVTVNEAVARYNFPEELNELLCKVDREVAESGDHFDCSATIKHLRTFFEKVHIHARRVIIERLPSYSDNTPEDRFGQVLDYLLRKDVIREKYHNLGKSLYGFLSNEGVHSIASTPEFVRLSRNMVVEYTVVLFRELDNFLNANSVP